MCRLAAESRLGDGSPSQARPHRREWGSVTQQARPLRAPEGLGTLRVGPSETPATLPQEGSAELQEESGRARAPFHGETSARSGGPRRSAGFPGQTTAPVNSGEV